MRLMTHGVARTAERPHATRLRRVDLVLLGATGRVGRVLLRQFAERRDTFARELRLDLRLVLAASSRAYVLDRAGLEPEAVCSGLLARCGRWSDGLVDLSTARGSPRVLVDCTASPDVAGRYSDFLEEGMGVVTANKLALAGPLETYRTLKRLSGPGGPPLLYETTVAAAIPIVRPLEEMRVGGDRLRALRAVLSGSLSTILGRVNDGIPFSEAVRAARDLGLTEPHPREDLTGRDVGRKLLILLREAGLDMEPRNLDVESLLPDAPDPNEGPASFLRSLARMDEAWSRRAQAAKKRGERLAYVASFTGGRASVGLRSLPADAAEVCLQEGENVVTLHTERYARVPLTVRGPGAGAEVTASGVLADVVRAARMLDT